MSIPKTQREIQRKLKILTNAAESQNVSKICRYFGVYRDMFYEWKKAFKVAGDPGLIYRKRGPRCNLARRVPIAIEEKILHLRGKYHFGSQRIVWYLMRYHATRVSTGEVYQVLRRNRQEGGPISIPRLPMFPIQLPDDDLILCVSSHFSSGCVPAPHGHVPSGSLPSRQIPGGITGRVSGLTGLR